MDKLKMIEKEARTLLRLFPIGEMTAKRVKWMVDQMRKIDLEYKCEWEVEE